MALAAVLIGAMAGALSFVAAWLMFDFDILTALAIYFCAGFGSTILTIVWALPQRQRGASRSRLA